MTGADCDPSSITGCIGSLRGTYSPSLARMRTVIVGGGSRVATAANPAAQPSLSADSEEAATFVLDFCAEASQKKKTHARRLVEAECDAEEALESEGEDEVDDEGDW